MPVVRVDNYLDAYRLKAQSKDPHDMSGREGKPYQTEFANNTILKNLRLDAGDILLDIGCGDGCLLKITAGRIANGIGITASEEERRKLQSALPQCSFIAAQAQSLPLPPQSATKIVCNATLFYLPTEDDVRASLREMARIARAGATIWVGEIPEVDEYARYGMYRGNSMLAFLWHLLIHNGPRAFLSMIYRWGKATFGQEQIVLNSAGLFYASPEKMIFLAQDCGLKLKTYFRHRNVNAHGQLGDSDFRYDYIFTV